jgi:hypothetical protein
VNFCLSSGLSALVVFVSFLSAILASAFYKYTISREQMLLDDDTSTLIDNDDDSATPFLPTMEPSISSPWSFPETIDTNSIDLLIEINEQTSDDSKEEFQTKLIEHIYDLSNDNELSSTDFINQLKMYGFEINDEIDLELS